MLSLSRTKQRQKLIWKCWFCVHMHSWLGISIFLPNSVFRAQTFVLLFSLNFMKTRTSTSTSTNMDINRCLCRSTSTNIDMDRCRCRCRYLSDFDNIDICWQMSTSMSMSVSMSTPVCIHIYVFFSSLYAHKIKTYRTYYAMSVLTALRDSLCLQVLDNVQRQISSRSSDHRISRRCWRLLKLHTIPRWFPT